jgi:hypothetical protein
MTIFNINTTPYIYVYTLIKRDEDENKSNSKYIH